MTDLEYAEQSRRSAARPAHTFRQIVKRLLSAPSGELGPTLLVERNERDAVVLLESEYLIVLLASDPDEDLASTLPERLDAAFASERREVREAVDRDVMWVVLVNCGRPLSRLGLVPGKPTGTLGIKPQFLRIEDGTLVSDELVGGRSHARSCREVLSAALESSGHSLGPGGIRARERAGEHALASEADAVQRAKSAYPGLICMGLAWIGLAVAANVFGGFEEPSVLVRMGALEPGRVRWAGEWWRLLTAPYLHASVEHVYSNLMAGGLFGVVIAGSLGAWRTLALFQVSALAGSALAFWSSRSIGVGASGGVFGLLGASLVLAGLKSGFVPLRDRRGLWLMGLLALAFNVVASLRPEVSFAAHAGGLLAGVALSLSGVILVGLPPLDSPPGAVERYKGGFAAVALGLALLSAMGFAVCWTRYSPWQHRWPLEPETRRLEGSPIVLEVPASLSRFVRIGGSHYVPVAAGDPVRVEIEAERQPLSVDEALVAERDALERSWPKQGFTWLRRPELTSLGPKRVLRAAIVREEARPGAHGSKHPRRFEIERMALVEAGWRVRVTVTPAPNLDDAWKRRIEAMLSSVRVDAVGEPVAESAPGAGGMR